MSGIVSHWRNKGWGVWLTADENVTVIGAEGLTQPETSDNLNH